jgi:hypothetical protein
MLLGVPVIADAGLSADMERPIVFEPVLISVR